MATCVCVFYPEGSSGVSGSITMSQTQEDGPTVVEGTVRGLTPGQRHGISLCTYGDVRDSSSSCGPIFNPFGTYMLSKIARSLRTKNRRTEAQKKIKGGNVDLELWRGTSIQEY